MTFFVKSPLLHHLVRHYQRMSPSMVVEWRGSLIGTFLKTHMDMWLLEGEFVPNSSEKASEFVSLAATVDFATAMKTPQASTRVILYEENRAVTVCHALVMSWQNGILLVNCFYEEAAIQWLRDHVT